MTRESIADRLEHDVFLPEWVTRLAAIIPARAITEPTKPRLPIALSPVELMRVKDHDREIDESIRLVAAFMKIKDEKARSEIIKLAETHARFERGASLFQSNNEPMFG
ncbi:hypothetical protein CQ12_40860 [Bradyrhizobium jicamae]|uniref:Uncharacterized protein n=1 Tax=Bradyrhizobium jicamae TaxID=280332 RepID=A0A0R3LN05_9BRAD|nr:hypothetical protein [Bradyrhizobium jicamae]KRR09145.1 hypothetical protein CQ12_40860 [Bradyrhizobium jicamae]